MSENLPYPPVSCPVCQSLLHFKAANTTIIVCTICNSLIKSKRNGTPAVSLPISSKPYPAAGIFGVGAKGQLNEKPFTIIGSLLAYFNHYYSTYWTIIFDNGQTQLLNETHGNWAVMEPVPATSLALASTLQNLDVGTESFSFLDGTPAILVDKAKCEKLFVQGEMEWSDDDSSFFSYEIATTNNKYYMLLELGNKRHEVFCLQNISYTSLAFYPALPALPTVSKNYSCTHCGEKATVRLPYLSAHYCCHKCNGWSTITPAGLQFKNKFFSPFPYQHILPGNIVNHNNIKYTVVGACEKAEADNRNVKWREYCLFSVQEGFAWLSEYNGHWIWLTAYKTGLAWPAFKDDLLVEGQFFDLFNKYAHRVMSAIGEFTTPLSGGGFSAREYIAPPDMYMAELNEGKSLTWFKGTYISAQQVADSFSVSVADMPPQVGIGALQTQRWAVSLPFVRNLTLIALAIFLVVQIYFSGTAKQEVVFFNTYQVADSMPAGGLVSNPFQLKAASSNMEFTISSPVSNNWFEAAIVMVNEQTGQEYNFEKGVEYYFGYDGGEKWDEGSQTGTLLLSAIPAGTYHLNIFPSFGNGDTQRIFTITATNDVPMWRNFMVAILILLLYPFIAWWRSAGFEQKRWHGSDFDPN
jgi:ribosomal protein L37AE/L43A